jgi:anthranilate phosphoribosyltransferase
MTEPGSTDPRGAEASTGHRRTQARTAYPGFRTLIKAVGTGPRGSRSLRFEEAREAMALMLAGEVSDGQAGAFLIAMRIKGETPEELAGIAQALRDAVEPVSVVSDRPLVACAGAYDGVAEAPQLSLAAAVVAAAAGAGVVVHCGDSLGPKHGVTAADVLAALGGDATPGLSQSAAMLARAGVALVHAAEALPGWRRLAALRDEIGLRGPVHSAEKLVDYLGARRFVVGHTHGPYGPRLCGALALLDAERAVAVRGVEGSDVMRPGRPVAVEGGATLELPERLGERLPAACGAEASAALTRAVVEGDEDGTCAYAVMLSAGLRLAVAGVASDPVAGMAAARAAVADGRAGEVLAALVG